jgi:hypothetical protein
VECLEQEPSWSRRRRRRRRHHALGRSHPLESRLAPRTLDARKGPPFPWTPYLTVSLSVPHYVVAPEFVRAALPALIDTIGTPHRSRCFRTARKSPSSRTLSKSRGESTRIRCWCYRQPQSRVRRQECSFVPASFIAAYLAYHINTQALGTQARYVKHNLRPYTNRKKMEHIQKRDGCEHFRRLVQHSRSENKYVTRMLRH